MAFQSNYRSEGPLKDPREPDEELLENARQAPEGDYRAFELLVRRYQKKVITNCRFLTRNAAVAEDLAQEVFVKIFFNMRRFEGRSSVRTWIQRVKANHCLTFLKKQGERAHLNPEDDKVINSRELVLEPVAEKNVMNQDERERIAAVLDAMPDSLRIPLLMRDMDQLSYQEVADALGVGLSAAKMRIKRGREEFRHIYSELNKERAPRAAAK
jgi:RNA polymerase sigma-70 factor, ECF subfamily